MFSHIQVFIIISQFHRFPLSFHIFIISALTTFFDIFFTCFCKNDDIRLFVFQRSVYMFMHHLFIRTYCLMLPGRYAISRQQRKWRKTLIWISTKWCQFWMVFFNILYCCTHMDFFVLKRIVDYGYIRQLIFQLELFFLKFILLPILFHLFFLLNIDLLLRYLCF